MTAWKKALQSFLGLSLSQRVDSLYKQHSSIVPAAEEWRFADIKWVSSTTEDSMNIKSDMEEMISLLTAFPAHCRVCSTLQVSLQKWSEELETVTPQLEATKQCETEVWEPLKLVLGVMLLVDSLLRCPPGTPPKEALKGNLKFCLGEKVKLKLSDLPKRLQEEIKRVETSADDAAVMAKGSKHKLDQKVAPTPGTAKKMKRR